MDALIDFVVVTFVETTIFGLIYIGRFSYRVKVPDPDFLKLSVNILILDFFSLEVFREVYAENLD